MTGQMIPATEAGDGKMRKKRVAAWDDGAAVATTLESRQCVRRCRHHHHHRRRRQSLLTPPATPPAKSPSPAPRPETAASGPQNHDPYLDGATIEPAELLCARPPVPVGASSMQSFVFSLGVPRDYTKPRSRSNSYELHVEILRSPGSGPALTAAPIFTYLCGGPGSGQQPGRHELLNRFVLANGYQMLLVDYRGCGRSQPLTVEAVQARRRESVREAVLAFQEVRQGNIVRDLEAIRLFLLGHVPGQRELEDRMVLLGQSYGGWIALTYLDRYPRSIAAVLLTGGMPPLESSPEEVYHRLFEEVASANEAFYAQYPGAQALVRRIACEIVKDGGGGRPRKRRRLSTDDQDDGGGVDDDDRDDNRPSLATFASMGRILGEPEGARKLHERLQQLGRRLDAGGSVRVADVDTHRFNDRLPYAFDHEIQCYVSARGQTSRWAARTVRDGRPAAYGWLAAGSAAEVEAAAATHFLGEAFMPEHADDYAGLRALGGRAFADAVADAGQTETLFDMARLAANRVPVYAIIYRKDMYVDADLAVRAAAKVGAIRWRRLPEDSPLRHNAVRESAAAVVDIFRSLGFDGFPRDPEGSREVGV